MFFVVVVVVVIFIITFIQCFVEDLKYIHVLTVALVTVGRLVKYKHVLRLKVYKTQASGQELLRPNALGLHITHGPMTKSLIIMPPSLTKATIESESSWHTTSAESQCRQ